MSVTLTLGKVTNMRNMFRDCCLVKKLDLSKFDTKNVTNMKLMFGFCSSLVNLGDFDIDTSKVKDTEMMFESCFNLSTQITIRNPLLASYSNMFEHAGRNADTGIIINYTLETEELVDNIIEETNKQYCKIIKGEKKVTL